MSSLSAPSRYGSVALTEAFLTNADAFTLAAQTETAVWAHTANWLRVSCGSNVGIVVRADNGLRRPNVILVLCRCDV